MCVPVGLTVCLACELLMLIVSAVTVKATVFDPHGTELSGERGTSTAFSGEGEETSCYRVTWCS